MTRALSILLISLLIAVVALAGDRIYLVVTGVVFNRPAALFDANNAEVYDANTNRVYKQYP